MTGTLCIQTHKALVLLLTFWCYACFHASRKPLSVVKSVLTGENNATMTYWAAYDTGPLDPGRLSACKMMVMQQFSRLPEPLQHLFEEDLLCILHSCCSSRHASPQHE